MPAHLCEMPGGGGEAGLVVVVTTNLTIPAVHDLLAPDLYCSPYNGL